MLRFRNNFTSRGAFRPPKLENRTIFSNLSVTANTCRQKAIPGTPYFFFWAPEALSQLRGAPPYARRIASYISIS